LAVVAAAGMSSAAAEALAGIYQSLVRIFPLALKL
jgi:hypothetical protein